MFATIRRYNNVIFQYSDVSWYPFFLNSISKMPKVFFSKFKIFELLNFQRKLIHFVVCFTIKTDQICCFRKPAGQEIKLNWVILIIFFFIHHLGLIYDLNLLINNKSTLSIIMHSIRKPPEKVLFCVYDIFCKNRSSSLFLGPTPLRLVFKI